MPQSILENRKTKKRRGSVKESERKMRSIIKIADKLDLPLEAVTQTFAQIGRKGAGKTYLASMIAEQMLEVKAQVIVIDPIGNWWGLRVNKDGKSKGKEIFIIGGEHKDVGLSPDSGKEIAKFLVESNISVVLDISEFRKNERKRFVTDFAEEFYHLKKNSRTPVHVFLEESQKFVPQRISKDEARMLGAWEDIVRLGRNYGIGCSMISQRPQSINKEVFSQVECLCVLQVTGLHERKALTEWVQEAGADRQLVGQLPGLHTGEGFVWSPGWLRIFKKVNFLKKTTFDTSSTPELGKASKTAKISKMDIEKLRMQMEEIVGKVKQEFKDVEDYKKKIKELEFELKKKQVKYQKVTNPNDILNARRQGFFEAKKHYDVEFNKMREVLRIIKYNAEVAQNNMKKIVEKIDVPNKVNVYDFPQNRLDNYKSTPQLNQEYGIEKTETIAPVLASEQKNEKLRLGAMRMLKAIAMFYPKHVSKQRVATLSGFSAKGGSFNTYWSELRRKAWIEEQGKEAIITQEGLHNAGEIPELPTNPNQLVEMWASKFRSGAAAMLKKIAENYPQEISKEELGIATNFTPSGGTFNTYLSELRRNGLIKINGQTVKASKELFLEDS